MKLQTDTKNTSQLASFFAELREGFIVCDTNARILFCNPAGINLLKIEDADDVSGCSLCNYLTETALVDNINLLKNDNSHDVDFVCTSTDKTTLLDCHIKIIEGDHASKSVLIITLDKITHEAGHAGTDDSLLHKRVNDMRAPLANLRAAAENLASIPDMSPVMRIAFENVIAQESANLTENLEALASRCQNIAARYQPFSDINSKDLIYVLRHKLTKEKGPEIYFNNASHWFNIDAFSVVTILEKIFHHLRASLKKAEFKISMQDKLNFVYLDIIWDGAPISTAGVESMLLINMPWDNELTIGSVLESHGCDIWSQQHDIPSQAMLRIPLPASSKQRERKEPGL